MGINLHVCCTPFLCYHSDGSTAGPFATRSGPSQVLIYTLGNYHPIGTLPLPGDPRPPLPSSPIVPRHLQTASKPWEFLRVERRLERSNDCGGFVVFVSEHA